MVEREELSLEEMEEMVCTPKECSNIWNSGRISAQRYQQTQWEGVVPLDAMLEFLSCASFREAPKNRENETSVKCFTVIDGETLSYFWFR